MHTYWVLYKEFGLTRELCVNEFDSDSLGKVPVLLVFSNHRKYEQLMKDPKSQSLRKIIEDNGFALTDVTKDQLMVQFKAKPMVNGKRVKLWLDAYWNEHNRVEFTELVLTSELLC